MIDYQVQLMDFPSGSVKEAVTANEDGSFTIFIAESLSKEGRQKAFLHAMKHIMGDDFSKDDINAIERMAHAKGDMYYETDFY